MRRDGARKFVRRYRSSNPVLENSPADEQQQQSRCCNREKFRVEVAHKRVQRTR
jgi:hypothetical protein